MRKNLKRNDFYFIKVNLEQAENLIKRHEAFLTTMEANDDKINNVVLFANRLCDEGHFECEHFLYLKSKFFIYFSILWASRLFCFIYFAK